MRTVPEDLDARFKIVTAVCELARQDPVVSLWALVVPKQLVREGEPDRFSFCPSHVDSTLRQRLRRPLKRRCNP